MNLGSGKTSVCHTVFYAPPLSKTVTNPGPLKVGRKSVLYGRSLGELCYILGCSG